MIKSHHNVGGLPEKIGFERIVEPLRELFKDEVRAVGLELGIPEELVMRQPFPGPGLAIRVMGEITEEKLTVLREADAIFREEIMRAGLADAPSQYFAVLTDNRSVGVMGDARTYGWVIALRAVSTDDFMTADWSRLPWELLAKGFLPHYKRGPFCQPRGLRHHVQTARDGGMGIKKDSRHPGKVTAAFIEVMEGKSTHHRPPL